MMGGSDDKTLVLVGKTGNGKSATGNTILGRKAFQSKRSLSGVTSTSEKGTTVLEDGQILTVIDTPDCSTDTLAGLFDSSVDHETIGKEIVSCIKMAIDGIHALLLVFSVRTRFSEEEKAAIRSLQELFGEKICDYMIVIFTGADDLEEEGKNTLEEFLCDCPESLKEILCLCGNRCVLFDNRTNDQTKKATQIQQLLSCVNMVLDKNGGEPFTNEIFTELQNWKKELEQQNEEIQALKGTNGYSEQELLLFEKKHAEQLNRISEMVEVKLMNMKLKFENQMLEERVARMRIEEESKTAKRKVEDDLYRLKEELQEAKRREEEELKKWAANEIQQRQRQQGGCVIL